MIPGRASHCAQALDVPAWPRSGVRVAAAAAAREEENCRREIVCCVG